MVTSHLLSLYIATKFFFSDEEDEPGWRVVLRTEVRGRRVDSEMEEHDEIPMFAMGADYDFHMFEHYYVYALSKSALSAIVNLLQVYSIFSLIKTIELILKL